MAITLALKVEKVYWNHRKYIWKEISNTFWSHCVSWPAWIEHWCVRGFLCSSPFIPKDRVVCLQSCIEFQLRTQARQKIFKLSAQSLQFFFYRHFFMDLCFGSLIVKRMKEPMKYANHGVPWICWSFFTGIFYKPAKKKVQ